MKVLTFVSSQECGSTLRSDISISITKKDKNEHSKVIFQISHQLSEKDDGEKTLEAGIMMLLSCDPYYKRHLQEVPDEKQKSSAPEIEQELKTAFELYSKVCFLVMFLMFFLMCNVRGIQTRHYG